MARSQIEGVEGHEQASAAVEGVEGRLEGRLEASSKGSKGTSRLRLLSMSLKGGSKPLRGGLRASSLNMYLQKMKLSDVYM